jgi:indolepyruvate ferredoxin oxidoreductase alpha subunit
MEEQIKAMGLNVIGKELLPKIGEMSVAAISEKLLNKKAASSQISAGNIPMRPPVLCSSCPHRGVYHVLSKQKDAIFTGDIGCYTLGALPPLNVLETCMCMGASIGNALGMSKMLPEKRVIAIIGDSTFIHSGVTGLMDVVYNNGILTVVILDNYITAMTGHQHHPATGFSIRNEEAYRVDLEAVVKACGVNKVFMVDAYNMDEVEKALKEATTCGETAVIIARQPCVLLDSYVKQPAKMVNDNCKVCKMCMKIGCPAIENKEGKIVINETQCSGCALCVQMCRFDAIVKAGG